MSRINTNVSSMVAQNALGRSNGSLQTALNRLSTGLRINSGKDDPAGLIGSENLRRDITATRRAIGNSERASHMIATADSALGQVSNLLNDIRGLIVEAANSGVLSTEQIDANQLQVDSSLEAIDRIAKTTTFQGRSLLDGSLDFQLQAGGVNGVGLDTVRDLRINVANLGATGTLDVQVNIVNAAEQAELSIGANAFTNNALNDDLVIKLAGKDGAEVFTFQSSATIDDVANAINFVKDSTGVEATVTNGAIELNSIAYGTRAFVDLEVVSEGGSGTFKANVSGRRDAGLDVNATVNGIKANGDGNRLSINTSTLSLGITVEEGSSTAVDFTIEGGGAIIQLGPDVVSNQQARLGIQSLNTGSLGGDSGRLYELRVGNDKDLTTDPTNAAKVVDEVITKVAELRGRLGAFQKTTIDSNVVSLSDLLNNLTEAESSIRDADFAQESAMLTRAQVLVQSGTSVLSIANQNPQNVLSLLR
jgi:flagellin